MNLPDRRLLPARPDLAAAYLRGQVEAARFVEGERRIVVSASAPVRRAPRFDAGLDTEALHGEGVVVYEDNGEGWVWGQIESDGYVGYLPSDDLGSPGAAATHVVVAPRTFVYPGADLKLPPFTALPMGAQVVAGATSGDYVAVGAGFVHARHLAPLGEVTSDAAAVAEHFRGVPYLWGGRTALGLDCSALVQLALMGTGIACPRDSDLQAKEVGAALDAGADLRRGDLVFWKGHVGMMLDGERLIHANGHHMMVEVEPLALATARIDASGGGPVTSRRRP